MVIVMAKRTKWPSSANRVLDGVPLDWCCDRGENYQTDLNPGGEETADRKRKRLHQK